MSGPTIEHLDRDEALSEALEGLYGSTRAAFLRTTAFGGAAMLGALLTPSPAAAALTDIQIFNFGLRFEYLQASFYTEADELGTIGRMTPRKQQWAHTLGAHERAHVKIIKSVLGRRAAAKPFFDFRGNTETDDGFTRTAVAMEDLTVALLAGVTPQIRDRNLTAALFGLLTVEARHAAWARNIVGATPSARAFDEPRSVDQVRAVVASTKFVVQRPRTTARRRAPKMTG
ncbi:MAG TPA: ferritin-like domain-containing protein [Solirubrobacteraceae bacterium]|nr:ferritin-like domain-containing protein [Solirubrobacteraceae bacterium]